MSGNGNTISRYQKSSRMDDPISIREYNISDKEAVIDLFRLNTPRYFAPDEMDCFNKYLDSERELYYVILFRDRIVGSGGINFADNRQTGRISWDIIHPAYQGRSFGSRLLRYRIAKLKSLGSIQKITVRTSQLAYRFYEKHGFRLNTIRKNYWAEGFDMYAMVANIDFHDMEAMKSMKAIP